MPDPPPLSEAMKEALQMGVDSGIELCTGDGEPFLPVAFIEYRDGTNQMEVFVAIGDEGVPMDYPDCIAMAKRFIDEERDRIRRYVIVWDGYVTTPESGQRQDAILVEGSEQGAEFGAVGFMPYRLKGFFKKRAVPAGKGGLMNRPRSRLLGPDV
jgi:hypothetical protein